jgi:hypothetical protein
VLAPLSLKENINSSNHLFSTMFTFGLTIKSTFFYLM